MKRDEAGLVLLVMGMEEACGCTQAVPNLTAWLPSSSTQKDIKKLTLAESGLANFAFSHHKFVRAV